MDDDLLHAFGTRKLTCPATFELVSKGDASLRTEKRTWGDAQSITNHWGIWWIGKSTCPEAGWTEGGQIFGYPNETRRNDTGRANDFFETRGGSTRFEEKP